MRRLRAIQKLRWRVGSAALALLATIAMSDPRLAAEIVPPTHQEASCCIAMPTCCEGDAPPPQAVTPVACACCLPTAPVSPPEARGQEATVSESEDGIEAPDSVARVTTLALPHPTSTPQPSSIGTVAALAPPIFLRTCHLRF